MYFGPDFGPAYSPDEMDNFYGVPYPGPEHNWAYQFDMQDFCRSLAQQLKACLTEWCSQSENPEAVARVASILQSLGEPSNSCCQ
jgi:hypothetical protein